MAISQYPPISSPKRLSYPGISKISAAPGTDLWRKPPSIDIDNIPALLINAPIKIHDFHSARVTISANWNTLYDQGGLALFIPDEDLKKFLKTGVEFAFGEPHVGTVAASRWSDWSLVPTPVTGKVTIQVEREVDENGEKTSSLWVYLVDPLTGKKSGIREITWWFRHDIAEKESSDESVVADVLLVGLYAARPKTPEGPGREHEELEVTFEDFEVTLFDD
jgi:regulation of enolase protein 1 (concanavalin A-like superfamily)